MKPTIYFSLIVVLSSMSALSAWPGGRGDHQKRQGRMLEKMKKELALSTEQSGRVEAILKKNQTAKENLRNEMKPLYGKMQELLKADKANRSEFEKTLRNLSDLRIKHRMLEFDERQEIRGVLTAEQSAKWQKLMQDRKKEFMEKHKGQGRRET